ncbi:hypothetical protein RMN57_28535 [Kitasatospora sp. CM 4170]|uniref:Uncharacterized protein n=1 Tax=Kitasatospora aburaviensis TaxID=67265 RepID=A0ABW1F6B4_9ACTN|nr:hypothetical protein [Kitasatospora sp. CM 4170]WNM48348.1 hypothetical protein RMN57_28535 [Kitasatospora sp. CM 4170]
MYMICVRAETRDGPPSGTAVEATAVREGLEQALRGPARLGHARIRVTDGALDAVVFMTAGCLLEAEAALRTACGELTADGSLLAGWQVLRCEAESWLALGLRELPTRR